MEDEIRARIPDEVEVTASLDRLRGDPHMQLRYLDKVQEDIKNIRRPRATWGRGGSDDLGMHLHSLRILIGRKRRAIELRIETEGRGSDPSHMPLIHDGTKHAFAFLLGQIYKKFFARSEVTKIQLFERLASSFASRSHWKKHGRGYDAEDLYKTESKGPPTRGADTAKKIVEDARDSDKPDF